MLQTANWLTRSLDQRARHHEGRKRDGAAQDAFLIHGVDHLRPLNLKTWRCHPDARIDRISRVTLEQIYADAARAVRLKYFFTVSISAVEVAMPFRRSRTPTRSSAISNESRMRFCRRRYRRHAEKGRHRAGSPYGCKIPGSHEHPVVRAATPGEAGVGKSRQFLTIVDLQSQAADLLTVR